MGDNSAKTKLVEDRLGITPNKTRSCLLVVNICWEFGSQPKPPNTDHKPTSLVLGLVPRLMNKKIVAN